MSAKSSPKLKKRASQPLIPSLDSAREFKRKPAVNLSKRASKQTFERLSDEHMAMLAERSKKLNDFLHNTHTAQDARSKRDGLSQTAASSGLQQGRRSDVGREGR